MSINLSGRRDVDICELVCPGATTRDRGKHAPQNNSFMSAWPAFSSLRSAGKLLEARPAVVLVWTEPFPFVRTTQKCTLCTVVQHMQILPNGILKRLESPAVSCGCPLSKLVLPHWWHRVCYDRSRPTLIPNGNHSLCITKCWFKSRYLQYLQYLPYSNSSSCYFCFPFF